MPPPTYTLMSDSFLMHTFLMQKFFCIIFDAKKILHHKIQKIFTIFCKFSNLSNNTKNNSNHRPTISISNKLNSSNCQQINSPTQPTTPTKKIQPSTNQFYQLSDNLTQPRSTFKPVQYKLKSSKTNI